MAIEVGSKLQGKVTGITNFGAFVELPEGQTGLVHISEVADNYVKDINDHLKVGDVVEVKVINEKDGKIGLSIKKAIDRPERPSRPERPVRSDRVEIVAAIQEAVTLNVRDMVKVDLMKSTSHLKKILNLKWHAS